MKSGKQPGEGLLVRESRGKRRRKRQRREREDGGDTRKRRRAKKTRAMESEIWGPRWMERDLRRKAKGRANREIAAANRQKVRRKQTRYTWRKNGVTRKGERPDEDATQTVVSDDESGSERSVGMRRSSPGNSIRQ
jgi:hypothetical protein